MAEKCENCGKLIGDLETPQLFKNHIVCTPCLRKLRAQSESSEDHLVILTDAPESAVNSSAATSIYNAPSPAGKSGTHVSSKPVPVVPLSNSPAAATSLPHGAIPYQASQPMAGLQPLPGAIPMPAQFASARGPSGAVVPNYYNGGGYAGNNNAPVVNVVGLIGLILGIISLLGSWIPLVNVLTALIAVVAIILGIIGVFMARNNPRMPSGTATGALVTSILSLVVTAGVFFWIFNQASTGTSRQTTPFSQSSPFNNITLPPVNPRPTTVQPRPYTPPSPPSGYSIPNTPRMPTVPQPSIPRQPTIPTTPRVPSVPQPRQPSMPPSGPSGPSSPPRVSIPYQNLEVHGEGSVTVNDVTISYVAMKGLGTAKRPRNLSGKGEVLAMDFRFAVSTDAKESIKLKNPHGQPTLTIQNETASAQYVTTGPDTITLAPGESETITLYFPYPKIRTVDMTIELPGSMFERSYGKIEILLPKGSNYRPKPATQPAPTWPVSPQSAIPELELLEMAASDLAAKHAATPPTLRNFACTGPDRRA